MISIIIPAFNEEKYLPETLSHLNRAIADLHKCSEGGIETIVVDNASTDRTAAIAREAGARVIAEPEHNIGRVRNTGAKAATGDLLVFLDADTLIPSPLLRRVVEGMAEPACLGGAVDLDHQPTRWVMRLYLRCWRLIGLCCGMAQGGVQFCRRTGFDAVGGYDESIYMGEDVDFFWRLGKFARRSGGHVRIIRDVRAIPSSRRFDQWPISRLLIETNPIYIMFCQRRATAWRGWYSDVPR